MYSVRSNTLCWKYQRFTPPGCKDRGIRAFKFLAKTQFLYTTLLVHTRLCESVRDTNLFGQHIFGLLNSPSIMEVIVENIRFKSRDSSYYFHFT